MVVKQLERGERASLFIATHVIEDDAGSTATVSSTTVTTVTSLVKVIWEQGCVAQQGPHSYNEAPQIRP